MTHHDPESPLVPAYKEVGPVVVEVDLHSMAPAQVAAATGGKVVTLGHGSSSIEPLLVVPATTAASIPRGDVR